MKHLPIFLFIFLIIPIAFAEEAKPSARADIINTNGEGVGAALFYPSGEGVKIKIEITNLPLVAGEHGFHIHNIGSCEPPDFKSAGPHFNPTGKKHGLEVPEGHHAGDLSNILLGPDGKVKMEVIENKDVSLQENVSNSLFHEGGTSLVIHENADDYKTDPAGNAGTRVACGVIKKVE